MESSTVQETVKKILKLYKQVSSSR